MTARLHVPSLAAGRLEVSGEGHHHLARVLRARAGDPVVLFDGAGREADARIVAVADASLTLDVAAPRAAAAPGLRLTLLLALLKGEKMELVIQKATELGVGRIVPVRAARSVVRLDDARAGARRDRWRKIAAEAARQSGRADVPEIADAADWAQALAGAPAAAQRLVLHEAAAAPLPALEAGEIVLATGPEGGFTAEEIAAAAASGFAAASLGPLVLRAETAAIAAVAIAAHAMFAGTLPSRPKPL